MAHINYPYIISCAWNPKHDLLLQLNEIPMLTFKRKHVLGIQSGTCCLQLNDPSATIEVTNIINDNQGILTAILLKKA